MGIETRFALLAGTLVQLGVAADRFGVRVVPVAHPDRKRRSPVTIARNSPVDVVREPFAEAPFPDLGRMPVDARVSHEHRILELRRAYEPRRARIVEERCFTPPAVRVRLLQQRRFPEHTAPPEL